MVLDKDLYKGQEETKMDKNTKPAPPVPSGGVPHPSHPIAGVGEPVVWPDSVYRVRITGGGKTSTATFKGKIFTSTGVEINPQELDWDQAEMAAAEADPSLVIERFDKDGNLLHRDGTPYPTLRNRPPAQKKKGKKQEEE